MTLPVDEQILRLEVSVRNVRAVEVLESEDDFDREEERNVIGKSALATEQGEKLATAGVVE